MPTVPSVDATAGGSNQIGAPSVAPVRNSNPEQLQNLGGVLQQTGDTLVRTGQTIGDRVQDQVDDATVKKAETAALRGTYDLLNGDKGFLNTRGQDSVNSYGAAQANLAELWQTQADNLSNPIQKQMFGRVKEAHLLSFGKQMADHNHSQTVAWSATESKSRAESYNLLALNTSDSRYQRDAEGNAAGDFARNTRQMEAETLNGLALAGFAPDSATAKAAIRDQYTKLNTGIIYKLLDNHDPYGAKKWFDEQVAAGNIDADKTVTLGNAVKHAYDEQQSIDIADNAVAAAVSGGSKAPVTLTMPVGGSSINVTAGLGEERSGGRSHDGIDIAVPVGTQVMSPAAGKVIQVWNDEKFGGGLSVRIEMPNGYIAGFAHLSAANVKEGDQLQQGSVLGLSGKSGNATGPVLHYMMKDDKGQYVDPRQVSQAPADPRGISSPEAWQNAQRIINESDAPDNVKKAALARVQQQHAQARQYDDQEKADRFNNAAQQFYAGGMKVQAIRPSEFAQLTPEQQQKLKDEEQSNAQTQYNRNEFWKNAGSTDLQAYFIQNPDMLTAANVEAARPKLSNSEYLSLQSRAQSLKNNPQGVQEAQGVQETLKYLAGHAGVNIAPKSTADKQAWIDLNARVEQSINLVKSQNGGKITQDQLNKTIQQELIRRTVTTPRSPWNPLALFSPNRTETLPLGAVSTARGSDGKDHYLDRNGQDLGVVN